MAYRADIEIGVRGARDLEQLRSAINQTARAVDSLNEVVGQRGRLVQSIQNYTSNLDRAAQSLKRVGAGTEAETKAVREYVQILGQATTARERQNNLIEDQIRLQQTAARTARLAAGGVRENPNQYAGPIGPGAASAVTLSSKLYGRLEQLISQQKAEAQAASEAAAQIKEQARALDTLRNSEAAASAAARQRLTVLAEQRRAATTDVTTRPIAGAAYATPAGPGGSGVTRASAVAASTAVERQVAQVRRTEAQAELKIVKDRGIAENYISGVINRRLAAKAKELELERQQTAEVEKRAASERRKKVENVALGAGFPMLFGAGPGAVVGGALGGLIPGNPMLSVVTSAIGAQLDAAVNKISEIGIGLRELNFDRLEQSGLRVSQVLKQQVQLLVQLGQTSQAYKILQQEAARVTGTLPGTITDISNATGILNSAWNEFTNVASTTLGILGAPFAAALGYLVQRVSDLLKGVNSVVSLFAEGLKTVGEWAVTLVSGEEGLKRIKDLIDSINKSTGQGNAAFVQSNLIPLNEEIVLNRQILDLQKQRTAETNLNGKIQNSNIAYSVQALKNEQKYTEALVALNEKKNSISKEIYQQGLKQIQVIRDQSNEYAQQTRDLDIQQARRQEAERVLRDQEEQTRKRQQAIEEATRETQRYKQSILNLSKEESELIAAGIDAYAEYLKVTKGVEASIQSQVKYFDDYVNSRVAALGYERAAAQEAAKTAKEEEKILAIYELKSQLLTNQLGIRQALLRAQQLQFFYEKGEAQGVLAADKQRGLQKAFTRLQPDVSGAFNSDLNLDPNNKAAEQLSIYGQELTALIDKTTTAKKGAESIGTAFANSFQSLITGTQTAQQALASFFKGIGEAFVNMATEIIAKMVTMYAFKTLLNLFGGGGGGLFSGAGPVAMPAAGVGGGASMFMPGAPSFMAEGGFVTGPTRAIVGEGGEPEYVIPASKMRGAMSRYASGTRGSAVIPSGSDTGDTGASATGGIATVDVRYTVERINSVDYVTADQFQRGMQQAAAQGASQGERRALKSLQNNRSTRNRLGLR